MKTSTKTDENALYRYQHVLRLLNPAAPEHPSVRQTLALLEAQGARLMIGLQVLVETWVVATRPTDQNGLGLPATTARQLLDLCSQRFALVLENHTTFSYWLHLYCLESIADGKLGRLYYTEIAGRGSGRAFPCRACLP